MREVLGGDDVLFALQKWTDLIPRFNIHISPTKLRTRCSQALLSRELHAFHVRLNNKDFVTFCNPLFKLLRNLLKLDVLCWWATQWVQKWWFSTEYYNEQAYQLTDSLIQSKHIFSFFFYFLFGCTWFISDVFPSAFSNVSKLTPERFRIYENASSEHLSSRFLLCHINEDPT